MHAVLETEKGPIAFRFHPTVAPKTVTNFVTLARKGFYDGTTWHRVIANFVIQGGCPRGDGKGGPGYLLDAEISDRPHVRGTVAMARGPMLNSAGSQFYICRSDLPHLDGYDTVFGTVTTGLEVVDKIEPGDEITRVAIIDE